MAVWRSLFGVGVLVAALIATPGVATACACGGLLSTDPAVRVTDEMALLHTDGDTETVVMRLNLSSTADNAALVIPTPAPATVDAAPAEVFDELAELSAPRVEPVRKWVIGWGGAAAPEGSAGAAAGAPGAAGPTVLSQVRLGPLEATTLSGGDLDGLRKWLADNGYQLRPEISAGLQPYLREGWSVVAMRLTSQQPLAGPLAPVTLTFASDELVYPMRMSAQAQRPQTVVIYTLGEHRMQRADPDALSQYVDVDYAGDIAGRTDDPMLTELAGRGAFLTRTTTSIVEPAAITSDFRFAPAATDEPFQRVVYDYEYLNLTLPILAGMLAVAVAAVVVLIRWVRRRTRAP
ncbi:DUF2330 domain-containing protein [Mycolicibacterium sp.]|uniref:DUF2330 domain-containing protein n=1 Tax=Mycolicibacterium sp. TaxID=2320850 RepID=UPI003D14FCFE